jgi:ubiquinone/menaquinone biosynthesis C-methylase UbiE
MSTNELTSNKPVRPFKGMPMEGLIAKWYAKNGGRVSEQKLLVKKIKDALPKGGNVLEVAPGPGYLSVELAKSNNYKVTALEISKTFIEIAQDNAKKANVAVEFHHGNASDMPFQDKSFDFIICVAAFKNFTQPVGAIREMCRVLKPGGKACIVDLRRDIPLDVIDNHVKNELHMSGFNVFFTKLVFRTFLLKNAYTKAEIEGLVSQTNFVQAKILEDTLGMDIWLEKALQI